MSRGGHTDVPCPGDKTARSAYYPEHLCRAIHDKLDAHESVSADDCVGEACEAILEENIFDPNGRKSMGIIVDPQGNIVDPRVCDTKRGASESADDADGRVVKGNIVEPKKKQC